jgi:dihydroflavonol-4-reductase
MISQRFKLPQKTNVLVTGGTGFLGSYLIEQLVSRGYQVKCLAKDELNAAYIRSLNVEIVMGDLNDGVDFSPLLEDIHYVYHLAGITRARQNQDYYHGNLLATRHFIRQCHKYCHNLKRFIFVSSLSAAGPARAGNPLTENMPCHPVSHYGRSKMLAENEILQYRSELPITIVRPSAVYGPRDRDMFTYILLVKKGLQPLIGFKKKWLNLIHRDDLIAGIILAGEHPQGKDEIFFLGGEHSYSTEEIGDVISSILHKRRLKIHIPHSLVYLIGALSETFGKICCREVFFNLQKVREAVQEGWICSVEKAKNWLGFKESITLSQGMASTYQWYLDHGWISGE